MRWGPAWRSAIREPRHQLHRLGLIGGDRQTGDAGVGPRAIALANAPDGADERHLVAELVRHGGDGLVLALREIELLDLLGGVAEPAADHHVLVEVLVAMAHAAGVERDARL